MGVEETSTTVTLISPCTCVAKMNVCLVSMTSDREKRDLSERKWGSWPENKILKCQ